MLNKAVLSRSGMRGSKNMTSRLGEMSIILAEWSSIHEVEVYSPVVDSKEAKEMSRYEGREPEILGHIMIRSKAGIEVMRSACGAELQQQLSFELILGGRARRFYPNCYLLCTKERTVVGYSVKKRDGSVRVVCTVRSTKYAVIRK